MPGDFQYAEKLLLEGDEPAPNGLPIHGIYLITYLDEDGEECRKWHLEGNPTLDTIMGIVEMFKMRIAATTYAWDDD